MLISMLLAQAQAQSQSIIGTVTAPLGVSTYNTAPGASSAVPGGFGLLVFVSNIIKLATIVAGIWVLFNLITAGYIYITSQGDTNAANKVKDQITSSVLGLVVIIGAYTVIALVSLFLFGDAGFILNPKLPTP